MNTDPYVRLRSEWPSALGAMILLSRLRAAPFLMARREPLRLTPGARSKRVFAPIQARHLSVLSEHADPTSSEAIAEFVAAVHGFAERFIGNSDNESAYLYARAVYGLVYLAKAESVADLMLRAYAPLLRQGLWDRAFRYRVATTMWGDVAHLLYEVEGLDEAGDHEPFDWMGNLNTRDEASRKAAMADAGLPPLKHPGFPPQDVWIAHTNVQPIAEAQYKRVLRDLYRERGYVL